MKKNIPFNELKEERKNQHFQTLLKLYSSKSLKFKRIKLPRIMNKIRTILLFYSNLIYSLFTMSLKKLSLFPSVYLLIKLRNLRF